MSGFICSMVGASFTVAAVAQVLRSKKGITAVGNAQIDTAQSKFGGASALFDGTGDYLLVSPTSDFILGTGNWTAEMWIRPSSHQVGILFDTRVVSNDGSGAGICLYYDGYNLIYYTNSGSRITGSAFTLNTQQHIALVRNGNDHKMYFNGTQVGSTYTDTNNITSVNTSFVSIGTNSNSIGQVVYAGHMDEIRISNSARYTTNFTPSTTAFVNDANTLLLIHADGTNGSTFFEDDNGVRAPKGISAIGNAKVSTAQSKFGNSSYLGDGTGDYVRSPAGSHFNFGTDNFTIEYFIRFTTINTLYVPIALRSSGSIYNGEWWCEVQAGDNRMYWAFKNQAGTTFYANAPVVGTAMTTGVFHHIALVKNGSTLTQYLNGTANGNVGINLTGSFGNATSDLWVGAGAGGFSLNGHIDEVRISNSARYTGNFTPTTTAFVNDANTLLLLHMDGTNASTVFGDDNGVRASVAVSAGNQAQISTAQAQFGGSSIVFDGTDDFVSVTGLPSYANSNYTFECWARFDILPHNQIYAGGNYMMLNFGGSGDYVSIYRTGAGSQVTFQIAHAGAYGSFTKSGVNYAINTWYHLAVVRNSGVFKVFFNGTELTTFINDAGFVNSGRTQNIISGQLGKFGDGRGSWDGYMDEIRISNTARYTGDFIPSTSPFVNDANTQLLIHADGTNGSTTFTDDNGVTPTHSYV